MVEVVGVEVEELASAEVSWCPIVAAVAASVSPCPPADVSTQPCRPRTSALAF